MCQASDPAPALPMRQGFGCAELLYSDYARLPAALETQLGARYLPMEELVKCAAPD